MDRIPEELASEDASHHTETTLFVGGGEMGDRIRSFNWSESVLGPPDTWPDALKTALRICLGSRYPISLWWARSELTQFYNDAFIPILGLSKHPEWLGKPASGCWAEIWDVMHPMLESVFETGEATWSEDFLYVLNRNLPQEEGYFTFSYSPLPDDQGKVAGIFCAVVETTGRVIGERRLQTLRSLSRAVTAHAAEEACATAARTLSANPADLPFALIYLIDEANRRARLTGSTGLEPGAIAAPNEIELTDQHAPWPLGEIFASNEAVLLSNLATRLGELPAGPWPESADSALVVPISAPGQAHPVGFLVAGLSPRRIIDADYRSFCELVAGHVATALANARAYEEERKRAEALAELDRAKTAFFSNVSHEFRTPLTLMIGPLESILNAEGAVSPLVREQVETAHRNSLRLLKLVNSLLDFSRIEAGRIKAVYGPMDLSSLTADIASNFRSAMAAGGVDLVVDCEPLGEPVYIDREMWEKIVLNLLSNAFKFTFEGRVRVTLRKEHGRAVLSVSDTGTGIPAHELKHIFERFHRVEGARGRTYEGTGIGLALIQELVKLHGGTITVESEIGKGSVFTIAIPFGASHLPHDRVNPSERDLASTAVRAEAFSGEALTWVARNGVSDPSTVRLAAPSGAVRSTRPQILLADDNADMREHVTRILGDRYEVIAVSDGAAALKAARERAPDLVISDVMMPVLDGFGLLSALRGDIQLREVPVILLSARAGEEARIEGINAGADDYLTKPFAATELVARVQTTLNLQRLRLEARAEIARSERQFRALVTATSDVIYHVSPDWRELRRLEGRDFVADTDAPSRSWLEQYIPPEDRDSVLSAIRDAISGRRPFELEHRVIRADGTTGWTFSRAVPLFDAAGEIVEWFGAARDITERKRTEEELRRANTALEQFAYTASHDLQEPIRTLKIYSELLTRHAAGLDKESSEFLSFIRSGASRMEAMVRDLLAYTQASLADAPTAPSDATVCLRATLDNLAGLITETAAVVEAGSLPFLPVRGTDLQHLFQNLIANAIKYRRPDLTPQIRISAERCSDGWRFAVADNGIGIGPEYHERIFRLFERLDKRLDASGTGIGLSICQRIVERYHGRIWVESESGTGATFYFTLPA